MVLVLVLPSLVLVFNCVVLLTSLTDKQSDEREHLMTIAELCNATAMHHEKLSRTTTKYC